MTKQPNQSPHPTLAFGPRGSIQRSAKNFPMKTDRTPGIRVVGSKALSCFVAFPTVVAVIRAAAG